MKPETMDIIDYTFWLVSYCSLCVAVTGFSVGLVRGSQDAETVERVSREIGEDK